MPTVAEIMKRSPVRIDPQMTLEEAAIQLVGHHLDGAPVVNGDLTLVGMLSEVELLEIVFDHSLKKLKVADFVSKDVTSVGPDDSLAKVSQLFVLYSYRRLPVVSEGKLLGVISRRDLVNHALRSDVPLAEPLFDLVPELAPMS